MNSTMATATLLRLPNLSMPSAMHTAFIATTTAIATASLIVLAKATLWPRRHKVLASPLKTVIPRLSDREVQALVYRPDIYPGARDVDTPV